MKLTQDPGTLGIDYHASSEFTTKDGRRGVRFILSHKLTPEQEKELKEYENAEIKPDAATYKYAPEIKYDVLYVFNDGEEAEAEAEESFIDLLNAEVENHPDNTAGDPVVTKLEVSQPQEDNSLEEYVAINSAVSMASSAILLYKELAERFPENKEVFDNLAAEREVEIGKLTALASDSTKENMQDGIEQGEALSATEDLENNQSPAETKFIELLKEVMKDDPYFKDSDLTQTEWVAELVYSEDSIYSFFEEMDEDQILEILNSDKGKALVEALVEAYKNDFSEEALQKALKLIEPEDD